jgi:hypothetical protein
MHTAMSVGIGFVGGVTVTLFFGVKVVNNLKTFFSTAINGVENRLHTKLDELKAAATKGISKL